MERNSHFWENSFGIFTDCGPLDIAVMLDSSGSVGSNGWRSMLDFIKLLLNDIPVGPSRNLISLISFGNEATMHFPLSQYMNKNDISNALDVIPWKNQWTNTSGALREMRRTVFVSAAGDRQNTPNLGTTCIPLI